MCVVFRCDHCLAGHRRGVDCIDPQYSYWLLEKTKQAQGCGRMQSAPTVEVARVKLLIVN